MDYGTSEIVAGVFINGPAPEARNYSLENPNLPLNDPAIWDAVFGSAFGTEVGIQVTAERAMMYAPFYHGVTMIAGDIAKLPRYVYKRRTDISDNARERDRGHRLNYILNRAANEYTEAIKFWERFVSDAIIYRHAYARIMFDGTGSPAELYNLLPDRTRCEFAKDGTMFYATEVGGRLVPLMPWEVLHVSAPPLTCAPSQALFQMARNSIALGLAQEQFASKFFRNGGRVGGILELPASMNKPVRDKVEEGFRSNYEGSDNPFKTVILRENAKFHAAQQSPKDSQLTEATDAQTRAMAHWLNLAPSRLGLSDSVSYNSKSEDNQDYLDTTLQIHLTRIESACNFRLISERQADSHFIEHSVKSLLRMNPLQMAQVHQLRIASRIQNPNEARDDLNMLPYEGGDEFVNPNTMKSGNEPGESPKEDEKPAEDDKPKRDAAYMRVLFGITARARDKAKRGKAYIEWIDGNLNPHRDEWRTFWGDEPFPFGLLQEELKTLAATCTEADLPMHVEALCLQWEDG